MATVFYYDAAGDKKQTDSSQLQTLVRFGVIKPDSILENANGARVQASRINGLNFNESFQRAGSDASSDSPSASAVPPTSPPDFGAPHSDASSPFSSAFQSEPSGSQTTGANPNATASEFFGSQTNEAKHCMACGALLTGAGRFCPRCGAPASGGPVGYCPACGAQIFAGQAVCTNCGRSTSAFAGVSSWFNKTFGTNNATYQNHGNYADAGPSPGSAPGAIPGAKNKTTAGILALLLGGLGIHKFYLGSWGWGIVYILCCWTYIPAILGVIEGIIYLTTDDYTFQAKYSPATQSAFRW